MLLTTSCLAGAGTEESQEDKLKVQQAEASRAKPEVAKRCPAPAGELHLCPGYIAGAPNFLVHLNAWVVLKQRIHRRIHGHARASAQGIAQQYVDMHGN